MAISARQACGNENSNENLELILQAVILIIAALPDLRAMTGLAELIVYSVECLPRSLLTSITVPLFDILCLQLRIPEVVSDDVYLLYYDVFTHNRGSANLAQSLEDVLNGVLELRRDAFEVLLAMWNKWPNGECLVRHMFSVLSLQLSSLVSITASEEDPIALRVSRFTEALIFVLGRLLEGAQNMYPTYDEAEDDNGSCQQSRAALPGLSSSKDSMLQNELEIWYKAVSLITLNCASQPLLACQLIIIQSAHMWVHASAILRLILDSHSEYLLTGTPDGQIISSKVLLQSALRICCECLW
eukprot:CAMPEP_0182437278 /NCGR_PEP_ID=MMETSP1167-20130531/84937_1 /TAXON_ID=2988 /ORGANISM="Mallomonas Sp, Strain CCMP3275" /LENGTH=300 /DNA_ID=CAMNT_0024630137 /DNA_START=510 /DNA_END=1409 /DNA_ORIENTATION=-